MVAYKEWGYQLFPALAFEDLASRTEKLGGKARVRELMRELRDKERDRMLEAEYGRSAVDSVHAREAAKVATKEAEGSRTTEGQGQEEQEANKQEQPAESRYMDEDGEGEVSSTPQGSGHGDRVAAGSAAHKAPAAGVLSAEVRERMEANRRLALERLRVRKAEAAAAAAAQKAKYAKAVPAGDISEDFDEYDLIDVNGERGDGAAGDDFEHDEAALAEMDAEEPAVKRSKTTTDYPTPATTTGSSSNIIADDTAAASTVAEVSTAAAVTLLGTDSSRADSIEELPVTAGVDANSALLAPPAEECTGSGTTTTANEEASPIPAGDDARAVEACHDKEQNRAATTDASTSSTEIPGGSSTSEAQVHSEVAKPAGSAAREGVSSVNELVKTVTRENREEPTPPAKSSASTFVGVELSRMDSADSSRVEATVAGQNFFGSPHRSKAALGGVPMSPLGCMFAGTDTPAEGGSMTVRAPVAGLFAEK